MGKLTKAGAEARHFLSHFRTLVRMSEMVDELSGYESEAGVYAKEIKAAKAELKKLQPQVEKLRHEVKEAEVVVEASHTKAARIQKLATDDAGRIRASANDDLRNQHQAEQRKLVEFLATAKVERDSFSTWLANAEEEKQALIAQTETLTAALDEIRAKLL